MTTGRGKMERGGLKYVGMVGLWPICGDDDLGQGMPLSNTAHPAAKIASVGTICCAIFLQGLIIPATPNPSVLVFYRLLKS